MAGANRPFYPTPGNGSGKGFATLVFFTFFSIIHRDTSISKEEKLLSMQQEHMHLYTASLQQSRAVFETVSQTGEKFSDLRVAFPYSRWNRRVPSILRSTSCETPPRVTTIPRETPSTGHATNSIPSRDCKIDCDLRFPTLPRFFASLDAFWRHII